MFDIITIGDSTLDQFHIIDEASLVCDRDDINCRICFAYGGKVPVLDYTEHIGGNAANVAVATRVLGLKSAIYTELGKDEIGEKIYKKLIKFKVDPVYIKMRKNKLSNHSAIITYQKERTIFSYHSAKEYKLPKFKKSEWIYLTSVSKGGHVIYKDLLKYIRNNNVKLVLAPGTYQLKKEATKIKSFLQDTYLFISNFEEALGLLGNRRMSSLSFEDKVYALLSAFIKKGAQKAVITAGKKGAFAYDGISYYKIGCYPVHVVEKTGAGDSFASAVIAALHYKKDLAEALKWGTLNAAHVMQIPGAQQGLLNKKNIEKILKNNPQFTFLGC